MFQFRSDCDSVNSGGVLNCANRITSVCIEDIDAHSMRNVEAATCAIDGDVVPAITAGNRITGLYLVVRGLSSQTACQDKSKEHRQLHEIPFSTSAANLVQRARALADTRPLRSGESEFGLQAELQLARCPRPSGVGAVGVGDLSIVRGSEGSRRSSKLSAVENVEGFGTEVQAYFLRHSEALAYCRVDLPDARCADGIAPQVSPSTICRSNECIAFQPVCRCSL
jgi:hypothetical protein